MKPKGRSYQTVTQVKVSSPEIRYVIEVDLVNRKEDEIRITGKGEDNLTLSGSKSAV
jgi:hypothetical protein